MALKLTADGLNVFPKVEQVEANPVAGGGHEVILLTRIEGQLTPVTIKLTKDQSRELSKLLTLGTGA